MPPFRQPLPLSTIRPSGVRQHEQSSSEILAVFRGAQRIVHNVYLTSHEGASADTIRRLSIKAVINCTPDLPHHHVAGVAYYRVPVEDSFTQTVSHYFDPVGTIIRGFVLKGYTVLIHCQAGVSRSASCLLAYMISHHNLSLREAFHLMKRRRFLIEPNAYFMEQLVNYERLYRGAPSVTLTYQPSGMPLADVLYDNPHSLPEEKVRQLEERAARLPMPAQPICRSGPDYSSLHSSMNSGEQSINRRQIFSPPRPNMLR